MAMEKKLTHVYGKKDAGFQAAYNGFSLLALVRISCASFKFSRRHTKKFLKLPA
jgi:hypothetical protein